MLRFEFGLEFSVLKSEALRENKRSLRIIGAP